MHTGGTSLAGIPANLDGYGGLLDDVIEVPWDDADALRAAIDEAGARRVAAFFCEPVLGAGGVFAPPPGLPGRGAAGLPRHRRAVRGRRGDHGVRPRRRVVRERAVGPGARPDHLREGHHERLPAARRRDRRRRACVSAFAAEGAGMFRHGYTYSGHAAVAAAALANLDIIEREHLLARAVDLEASIAEALAPLASHDVVEEVRAGRRRPRRGPALGRGARRGPGPRRGGSIPACREAGIMTRVLVSRAGVAVCVSPPLVLTDAEVEELASGLDAAMRDALERAVGRCGSVSPPRSRTTSTGWRPRPRASASCRTPGTRSSCRPAPGCGSAIADDEYVAAGATIAPDADAVFARRRPDREGEGAPARGVRAVPRRPGARSRYLHLAADEALTRFLAERGVRAIAYETVQLADGRLPLLAPMSEIAGRMAPQEGAKYLERPQGGRGVLMGGAAGVAPAQGRRARRRDGRVERGGDGRRHAGRRRGGRPQRRPPARDRPDLARADPDGALLAARDRAARARRRPRDRRGARARREGAAPGHGRARPRDAARAPCSSTSRSTRAAASRPRT